MCCLFCSYDNIPTIINNRHSIIKPHWPKVGMVEVTVIVNGIAIHEHILSFVNVIEPPYNPCGVKAGII